MQESPYVVGAGCSRPAIEELARRREAVIAGPVVATVKGGSNSKG